MDSLLWADEARLQFSDTLKKTTMHKYCFSKIIGAPKTPGHEYSVNDTGGIRLYSLAQLRLDMS